MRIALITPGITPYVMGGLQRHSFNLAREFSKAGVEVDLYHTDFKDAQGIDGLEGMTDVEKTHITSISIPWPETSRMPGHYVRELKAFSKLVFERFSARPNVDFVIAKSMTAWAMVGAKRAGMELPPIGVNLHGYEMFQSQPSFKSALQSIMMRRSFGEHARHADFVFSYGGKITEIVRDQLHIPDAKILEIPGGIDANWVVDAPSPAHLPRRFVFLGRYERRKGIEELHAAIAANPDWSQFAEFRFIGPIPEEKRLILPHVHYVGPISNTDQLRAELHQGDVLICPSHSEGMPNSILEGMAAGLAVIGTDVGAVRLMVSKDNGVLLPQISIQGLIDTISEIVNLPACDVLEMKNHSLQKVRDFTWDKIALKTATTIRHCIRDQ